MGVLVSCTRVHDAQKRHFVKRISIKDIARHAGVSHSTVSRALRGSELISAETVERIRRVADEAGYRPSAAARSLVTSRTSAIGVVVTTIADPFAAEVVLGIEEAAGERGYSVILANSGGEPEREMRVVRAFEERRVDGIIVTSSRVGAAYAEVLERARVPIVLVNNQHASEFMHSVTIDNRVSAGRAVAHLVKLGHRRIGYIGDRFGYQSDTERMGGYRDALGGGFDRRLVVQGDGRAEGGEVAMAELLEAGPTAVFCYNDMTAMGAMRAIAERGLRVPEDISVVGFDDLFVARYATPALTTVRQPMGKMGRRAVATLLELFEGNEQENVVMTGRLVVRKSTARLKEKKR